MESSGHIAGSVFTAGRCCGDAGGTFVRLQHHVCDEQLEMQHRFSSQRYKQGAVRGAIFVTFHLRTQRLVFKPARVVVVDSASDALWRENTFHTDTFEPSTWRVKDADTQSHDIISDA